MAIVSLLLPSLTTWSCNLNMIGRSLSTGVWVDDHFLSEVEVKEVVSLLPPLDSTEWYPCPLQEKAYPSKRCSKLDVARMNTSPSISERLSAAWGGSVSFDAIKEYAISVDLPTNNTAMRHRLHRDVFPERSTDAPGPQATHVVYLSGIADSIPTMRAGATLFPSAGVAVRPKAGRLLTWLNTCEDGAAISSALHGVGALSSTGPARITLHVPVERSASGQPSGVGEHVGCGREIRPQFIDLYTSAHALIEKEVAPHSDAKRKILMLLMKWRVVVLFVAGLCVSARRQARHYAACLMGCIGGGVRIRPLHGSSGLSVACQAAKHYLRLFGRLPVEVVEKIGSFMQGARNPYITRQRLALKRPMQVRLSRTYDDMDYLRDGRTSPPCYETDQENRLVSMVRPISETGTAGAISSTVSITQPLVPELHKALKRQARHVISGIEAERRVETTMLHGNVIQFSPWRA